MWWQRVIETSPYVVLVLAFVILRILSLFMKHQQRMTEILRSSASESEVAALRQELSELKEFVQGRAPAKETLAPPASPVDVRPASSVEGVLRTWA